jgi:hypothetical protein
MFIKDFRSKNLGTEKVGREHWHNQDSGVKAKLIGH